MSIHDTKGTRLLKIAAAVFAMTPAMIFASPSAVAANKYRAFYYDAQYRLLQVEDVPDAELQNRKLVSLDDSVMVVPMLTGKDVPLISGSNVPMSRFAVMAVYYTYDQSAATPNGDSKDVPALADKVEYLTFVGARTIGSCLARASTDPCLFPKRCHCVTTTCCCY